MADNCDDKQLSTAHCPPEGLIAECGDEERNSAHSPTSDLFTSVGRAKGAVQLMVVRKTVHQASIARLCTKAKKVEDDMFYSAALKKAMMELAERRAQSSLLGSSSGNDPWHESQKQMVNQLNTEFGLHNG